MSAHAGLYLAMTEAGAIRLGSMDGALSVAPLAKGAEARILIRGPLIPGVGTSYSEILGQLAEAEADPGVQSIVFDFDSPGGEVTGVYAAARAIRAAVKPTRAHVSGECCSAAYWLAAACGSIVACPTAIVGAVGAILTVTEPKPEALPFIVSRFVSSQTREKNAPPSTPEGQSQIQAIVDAHCQVFFDELAIFRQWDRATVEQRCGAGRVFSATAALAAGLVDQLEGVQAMEEKKTTAAAPDLPVQALAPAKVETAESDVGAPAAPMSPEDIDAMIAQLEIELAGLKAQRKAAEKQAVPAEAPADVPPAVEPETMQSVTAQILELKMHARIEPLVATGYITPAERAEAEKAYKVEAKTGVKVFSDYYGNRRTPVVQLGARMSHGAHAPEAPKVSAEEALISQARALCTARGQDPNGRHFANAMLTVINSNAKKGS